MRFIFKDSRDVGYVASEIYFSNVLKIKEEKD